MPVPDPAALSAPAMDGAVLVDQEEDDGLLPIAPNHKFFLVHYGADPGSWFPGEIKAGSGVPDDEVGIWWLPKLTADYEKPGLCLHRTLQNGEPQRNAYHNAHLHLQAQGAVIIPRSLGYCIGYKCRHPVTRREGVYYTDPWSTPKPVVLGRAQKFSFDRNRYHRWLLKLVREGFVEQPTEDIIRELLQRQQARVARRESQHDLPDGKRERLIEEAQQTAERVASAAVPEFEPAPRKPVRKAQPPRRSTPSPSVTVQDEEE